VYENEEENALWKCFKVCTVTNSCALTNMGDRPVCPVDICPGPDNCPENRVFPTRFAPLLFALGLGLGLEANRVGLQECGQIGPGVNSTPGKSGRGQADLNFEVNNLIGMLKKVWCW
jgi:hypothetical protein